MAVKHKLFHSKLALRVLIIVFIAALVPASIIAILSFQFSRQEKIAEIQQQLTQKHQYLTELLQQRLAKLRDELRLLSGAGHRQMDPPHDIVQAMVRRLSASNEPLSLKLKRATQLSFDASQSLSQGKSVLYLSHKKKAPEVMQLVNPAKPEQGLIISQIKADSLWRPIDADNLVNYCIVYRKDIIFCNRKSQPLFKELVKQPVHDMHFQKVSLNQNDYITLLSPLNLGDRYWYPPLEVMISKQLANHDQRSEKILIALPVIIAITIFIIFFFSIRLIQRMLYPLHKLREAMMSVAKKQFNTRVEIHSDDEFEELGNCLNSMSERLGKQFNALETMSRLDRMILSTLDIDNIVETVLVKMRHIVTCDSVSLLILDDEAREQGTLYYRPDATSTVIDHELIPITANELEFLRNNPNSILLKNQGYIPNYLRPICQNQAAFLLLPIFIHGCLTAIIILSYLKVPRYTADDLMHARDLAHRVAVALSNAAWEDKLYQKAHYDSLTNLPNRLLFQDRLQTAITRAKRDKNLTALMFLDLDRFKFINDSLGHDVGDEVLIETAKRLQNCVRSVDTVSRLGGDEFTIIIPDLQNHEETLSDLATIARKLLNTINKPYLVAGQTINFSLSIGIAIYPKDAESFQDLLRNADSAMYHAKALGKSNCQFYSEELNNEAKALLILENQLHRALENDEFQLYYQPRIDLNTHTIKGAECLIRWRHPEKGLISPFGFIPLAEESGLINAIGEWALAEACRQLREISKRGYEDLVLAVNISAHQFRTTGLVEAIKKFIERYQINSQLLELEITEGALMHDIDKTTSILYQLKELGVQLAIDDFGTGYSSLNYLRRFPIDTLKIDQSFVKDVARDKENAAIVNAIIALGHNLQLNLVAEGVENAEDLQFVIAQGCDEAQGFYYAKPLTFADFLAYLSADQHG